MALKALLDSLDGLSESDQAHYSKVTEGNAAGKFRLGVDSVDGLALGHIDGMRTTLEDRKAKHEKASKQLDGYRDADGNLIDPKSFTDLKAKLESMKGMVDKDKVETIVKDRIVEHQKKFDTQIEKLNTSLATKNKQLSNVVVKGAAIAAIVRAGIEAKQVDLLLPHVEQQLGYDDKGDTPKAFVIGANGNPRISMIPGSGHEDLMQPEELLAEMKDNPTFAPAFPGSGKSGTGAPSSSGGPSGQTGAVTLTRKEASDVPTYQRARAEADKRGVPLVTSD